MSTYSIGNGTIGKNPHDKYKFAFNPYPLLPLNGKAENGISGYFDQTALPKLLELYGSEVFDKVFYSHTIREQGIYPFFCVLKDPTSFSLASQLVQIQLFKRNK